MTGQLIKEFSVKLISFKLIGGILILMSVLYFINGLGTNPETMSESFSGSFLGLIVGIFFLYFSTKQRMLRLYDDGIEYLQSKPKFSSNWNDIVLLKSFQELGKSSKNLILMTETDTLSISSAFFKEEYLVEAFNIIKDLKRENICIEDDINWSR